MAFQFPEDVAAEQRLPESPGEKPTDASSNGAQAKKALEPSLGDGASVNPSASRPTTSNTFPGEHEPSPTYRWWQAGKIRKETQPRWWVRDILIAVAISAFFLATQAWLDDARSDREQQRAEAMNDSADRRENLRFVRDRAGIEVVERPFQGIDLRGQVLSGLQLEGADFEQARLGEAFLFTTNLASATLDGADLRDADLTLTVLRDATLRNTRLGRANFYLADVEKADFSLADLRGADLSSATGLGSALLDSTCYDDKTRWPNTFDPPNSFKKACEMWDRCAGTTAPGDATSN